MGKPQSFFEHFIAAAQHSSALQNLVDLKGKSHLQG
jgi:hypothetical protein